MKQGALLLTVFCLCFCGLARAQTLVYSLSYVETRASYHAHFANVSPFPGLRSKAENLAMLRNIRKTEIYSVSIANGKRTLLFSDEGTNLELKGAGAVSAAGKAYMAGTWREKTTNPRQGVVAENKVFEISLDGSRQFRKLTDLQPNQDAPVLNRQNTRVVFDAFVNGKYIVSVYAMPDWKLLYTWNLARLTNGQCPDCQPLSYGWLADGRRLYFMLGLTGEEEADHPEIKDTAYVVSEDGTDLGTISAQVGALQLPGYARPQSLGRYLLGQLRDGDYLFTEFGIRKGERSWSPKPFLVIYNPNSNSQKHFPLKSAISRGFLSPSGRFLAHASWVMDLKSGADKEFFSVPAANPPDSSEPNVILHILGWLN